MKKMLLIVLVSLSACFAQTKYPTINDQITSGNFTQAKAMIDSVISSQKDMPVTELQALEFEKDRMERIRLDFKKSADDMLKYIRKYYPEADTKLLEKFEKDRSLEVMVIDGQKKYFNRAASNLFLINNEAMKQKEKVEGPAKQVLSDFLKTHLAQVKKEADEGKSKLLDPVKMHITYTLTVDKNAVPEGEMIRCWLPYPREGHQRQSDIKLISVNSDEYTIASNTNAQRTLYIQKKSVKDEPTLFKMELEYTSSSEWFDVDAQKVKPYNTDSELYKTYTQPRAPHIVFTDEIKELSKKIVGNETNPYLKAKLIFEWVDKNIPWAGAREYSTIENIPAYSLLNRHGDCGIQTLVFMTLARLNGIPTKWQSGWMMHPVEINLHDWCEAYFEGYGWVPVDQSFGLQNYSSDPKIKYFYLGNMDSYRFIVNDDFSQPLFPAKTFPRSETVDFQRGEVEWSGGNLYFDKWDYHMDIKFLSGSMGMK